MSTTTFLRIFDDAAIFPPGLAPVDVAIAEHRDLKSGPYAELIGPLLIGTGAVEELVEVVTSADQPTGADGAALEVTLIARPGTPLNDLASAVDRVRGGAPTTVRLTGAELPHHDGWRTALDWGLPLAVEVDRTDEGVFAHLSEIAEAAAAGAPVRAKLRTQSTPDADLPDAFALARFMIWCVRRRLPFKLTGGLHHAVPTLAPSPRGGTERQHGLLNVLLATELVDDAVWGSQAAGPRAPYEEEAPLLERVIATLDERDGAHLHQRLTGLPRDRHLALRTHFTSYGCCGVLDPIGELTTLGLLPALSTDTTTDDKDD